MPKRRIPALMSAACVAVFLAGTGAAGAQSFLQPREQPAPDARPQSNHWNALGRDDQFRAGSGAYGTDVGRDHYPQTHSLGLADPAPSRPARPGAPRDTPTPFRR